VTLQLKYRADGFYAPFVEDYEDVRPYPALWPQRFNEEQLRKIRRGVGPRTWDGLYQGRPSGKGSKMFPMEWWEYYDQIEIEEVGSTPEALRFKEIGLSWDTAFEKGEANDYSVCSIVGFTGYYWYLLNVVRGRYNFPELKARSKDLYEFWKNWATIRDGKLASHRVSHETKVKVLIEKKSSGHSLIQELRLIFGKNIIAYTPKGSKEVRAASTQGILEAGRVKLPMSAAWVPTFTNEFDEFPNGAHDDQVDSLVQYLRWTRRGGKAAIGSGAGG